MSPTTPKIARPTAQSSALTFHLDEDFVMGYKDKPVNFGFNGLGEITYIRTYSRLKSDGNKEKWFETVERVINGTFSIQKDHINHEGTDWNESKGQRLAKRMYDLCFNFLWLPPGRGLSMMGTDAVHVKGLAAALQNCGFVSTKNIGKNFSEPFCFMMDASACGIGIGFDVDGAGKVTFVQPGPSEEFVVPDSREGWVESLKFLLDAYALGTPRPIFDYTQIRPAGVPLKTFGGVSGGAQPLIDLHIQLNNLLSAKIGEKVSITDIADIMNMIGVCIVSGNVRRSAQIMFGEMDDEEYINLKNYDINPARAAWGWSSNNSVRPKLGGNYKRTAQRAATNGEPGAVWMENIHNFGRMGEPDTRDDADGLNPCQPSWATVLTPDGIRTIGEINVGDIIFSGKRFTKVTAKWSTGVKQVNAYKTTAGTFYGTENHRVVSHGKKVEAKDAESIDRAIGPYQYTKSWDQQAVMDGLMTGDGGVHQASNNLPILYVGVNDSDYLRSGVAKLMVRPRPGISEHAWEVKTTMTAQELVRTYDRTVPAKYRYADNTTVASFLRGLYSANGSVVNNRITLKAASFKVIEQVQEMLSALGIASYYTTNQAHDVEHSNGTYTSKQSYDLNITADRLLFMDAIGFIQGYKAEKVEPTHGRHPKTTFDIKSVEYISTEEVFDITVEDDEHTYWTGGLLVSNCAEQPLKDRELCCLVETFPAHHDTKEQYLETLESAYLYGKSVTLLKTHWPKTNRIMKRNRRIGTSQSGIIQFLEKYGTHAYIDWSNAGYEHIQKMDKKYSAWFGVATSIRTTTIKPSGTVSLLAGATAGMHYPEATHYIKNMRISNTSDMLPSLRDAGYEIEPMMTKVGDKVILDAYTSVVKIPVKMGVSRSRHQVSMWEQLALAALIQKHWSDNAVSVTVTFNPVTEGPQIEHALDLYQYQLKAVSFLPLLKEGAYLQMPEQPITEQVYLEMVGAIQPIDWNAAKTEVVVEKFCDSDTCSI